MASIPSNGYAEVMAGSNNYSGSNSYDGSCPQTAIPPVVNNDLCNKLYVDTAGAGGIINLLTEKGSLIAGDGTAAAIFAQNPYETALTTTTVYDWNSLAIAQSRAFTTTVATSLINGTSIKITYNGTDEITGTITSIVGTTVTITITALASAVYTAVPQITTTIPITISGSVPNGTTMAYFPATTTPSTGITPANTIITNGICYIYDALPPSPTFAFTLVGTGNIQRAVSNTQPPPAYPGSPTPSSVTWAGTNGGCFIRDSQAVAITTTLIGLGRVNFGFPNGAPLTPAYFAGSLQGYQVPYSTGVISIVGNVCLLADPVAPQGLKWGVVSGGGGGGAVNSVSGGNNITISGALATPTVNVSAPLTSILDVGNQTVGSSLGAINITPLATTDVNVTVSGAGKLHAFQSTVGGANQPILLLENTNANANAVHLDLYKNSASPANNDEIGGISFHAKNAFGSSVEYARIAGTQRDITTASENGSLSLLVCENSPTPAEYLRINGVAGSNDLYKPLETRGFTIRNTTAGNNLLLSNTANNQSIQINNTGSSGSVSISATNQFGVTASGNFSIYGATSSSISCSQNLTLSVAAANSIIIPRNSGTATHLITDDANIKYYPDIIIDNANTNTANVPAPIYEGQRLTLINKGVTPVAGWVDYGANYGAGCYSAVLSSQNEVWIARSDTNKVEVWNNTMSSLLNTITLTGWTERAYCFYEESGFMFIGGSFTTVNGNANSQYGLTRCFISSPYTEDPMYDGSATINGVNVSGGGDAVFAITGAFGNLYCGGRFTQFYTSGNPCYGIFDVSSQASGGGGQIYKMTGNGVAGAVYALYSNGSKLFIGGDFGSVDINSGTPIYYPRLATWDGSSVWEDVAGNAWNATVYTLSATPYGKILVGGDFTSPQQFAAYVDSATPQSLASDSLNLPIGSILATLPRGCSFYNGNVYIFTQTQGVFVSSSFQNWTDLNIPIIKTNSILTYFDNEVKVGYTDYGYFQDRNTAAQTCIYTAPSQLFRYNGSAFQNYSIGIPYAAVQFVASGGYWYALSTFIYGSYS